MNYGETFKQIRMHVVQDGQSAFAKSLGITQSYLSLVENDKKKPSIDLLERLANRCQIPLSVLLLETIIEKDIPDHKREEYEKMKPRIRKLIKLFLN